MVVVSGLTDLLPSVTGQLIQNQLFNWAAREFIRLIKRIAFCHETYGQSVAVLRFTKRLRTLPCHNTARWHSREAGGIGENETGSDDRWYERP